MRKIIPLKNRLPDVEAIIENTRDSENPFANGYCPAHLIKDDYLTTGIHKYYDCDSLHHNKTTVGTITFITPEEYPKCLWIGKKIPFYEGRLMTGYATIIKILNKVLEN